MTINIEKNRENLYNSLFAQGFLSDEDGNPEMTVQEFGEQVDDEETAEALYENLVDAGVFSEEANQDGAVVMTKDDFLRQIHGSYARREKYPMTENQRGLYIDWEMNRETTQYNVPGIYKVTGASADGLKSALVRVIDCHPGLKVRFRMEDGDVLQVRNDEEDAVVDVSTLDSEPSEDFFQDKVRPFNLMADRLYRIEIIQTPSSLYLFKDFHHTIFDGFSNAVFFDELKACLNGVMPEKELYTMFDHALDEQKMLGEETFREAESYFDKLLSSAEPTVYPHSQEGTTTSNLGTMEFSVDSKPVDDFCKQYGLTSNYYFLTALTQLLHRVTREEEVLISTINNGRTDDAMMGITGMFVKTLPVSSVLNAGNAHSVSVEGQMRIMQEQLGETEDRMFYPYTLMSERHHLRPEILYVYHGTVINDNDNDNDNDNVKFEELPLSLNMVKMPLTVTIYNITGNSYTILLTYNPSFYSALDMTRLGKAIEAACCSMLTAKSVSEISLINKEDEAQLSRFHVSAKADVPYKLFHEPIEDNAVRYPDRTALIAKDRSLTFAQFNTEANRVAHALIKKGVKRGDRIVLLLPRTSAVIVSMFGVSKTGAAYIPCDPEYPADRINLIMTDSDAQYVITTKEHASDYPSDKVVLIDDIYNNENECVTDNPNVNVSPEDLAYLIYTSGSTGRPKGVMLRHVGITNYLYDHPANIHIHGLVELGVKSYVCITTLSFDMSLKEFAGALFNGITAILADEQEIMDAHLLASLMRETGCEAINGTCSRMLTYMELDEFREALSHLKTVWSGGEQYPKQLLTELQTLGVHILNTYGPTEITVSSNIADLTNATKVSVGRPLLNYEEVIVDQFDNELPVGFTGELLIGGPGVALGYNNLPEMTKERFVDYKGKRVYRSGDLARWNSDGQVDILGRNDGQVKLRGFRVELGEVEGIACKFEGVNQAVADIKTIGTVQHLCLYYTSETVLDEDSLKSFMAESLTEYMVPTAFVRIGSIPLTPNGKTNRKALPVPKLRHEEIVDPANETESMLLGVVKDLLKTDDIGVTTNLMTSGLSSIAAMRMSAVLLQHHGVVLRVKDIMKNPTVREMALSLTDSEETAVRLVPHPVRRWYPMTETQRGIFIDWSMHPKALQYNIPHVMKFTSLDVERMRNALSEVIESHPYLKCRISAMGDDFVQMRDDDAEVTVLEEEKLDFEPDQAFFQNQLRPFDLLKDQLFRFKLFTTPSAWYVLCDIHHIISDGTSNNVLAREIEKAYRGERLIKETYTAYDLAIDELETLSSERGKEAEEYFDRLVGGLDATVYPSSAKPESNNGYGEIRMEIDASDEIRSFCHRNAIAQSSFFLEVFHNVLHRITREDSTMIYFISNGKSEVQLENFFGVNVKTLPTVVSDFSKSVVESVKDLHRQMTDSISNDFYPFTKMVERHGLSANIIYNFMVDIQTKVTLAGADDTIVPLDFDTVKNPLSITIFTADSGRFECFIEYDSTTYSETDMKILGNMFCSFAGNCVRSEERKLKDISLMSDFQTETVAISSMGETFDYDKLKTFPDLVTGWAEETPDSLAVVDECSSYTYSELNTTANIIANELRRMGVGSEGASSPFVGIMLGCQKEFVAAAIGTEKAGGAYVPLDYEYPADRLAYMLEDSASSVLITSHEVFSSKTSEGFRTETNILFIDDFLADLGGKDFTEINYALPEGLAYMIYTSGSTGKPKGVMIPHKAKTAFVNYIAKKFHHTQSSRICCHSSFSFDASIEDLYPILTVGGILYVVPQKARKDIDLLHSFIIDNSITGGSYSTQFGMLLLQQYPDMDLDYFNVGGEKMTMNLPCKCSLYNSYGPTEFTVDSTIFELEPGREYGNIPIGRPLDNLAAYIVDQYGHLLPNGVSGELCMAGIQMAKGYWNRPELTEEKFNSITIGNKIVKVYHTGDLVRYNEENQLEYIGRIDSQVKLRGFRIELGEIESQIAGYEGIKLVKVLVKTVNGVQHLCAYYSADKDIDKDALREYLSSKLTEYMVPTAYIQLEEMPLTPNGKVNTKALPEPIISNAVEYVEPQGEAETVLAAAFADVLGLDCKVGAMDSFFNLGGDSIKAIKLISILRQKGIMVQVADIMEHKTVRGIASICKADETVDICQEDWSGDVSNSAIVDYFFNINFPKSHHFNQSVFLRHKARISKSVLEQTMTKICIHHDMLRAIVKASHLYVRKVDEGDLFVLKEYDLTDCSNSNDEIEKIKPLAEELQSSIDIYNGPLMHLGLFHLPQNDALLIVIHHTVIDGVSWRILLEDVQTVYQQIYEGVETSLPDKTHSYKDYVEAMERFQGCYSLSKEKDYWNNVRSQFAEVKMSVGTDFGVKYETVDINIDKSLTNRILSSASESTALEINDLLLCALSRSYLSISKEDSLSVLLEGHGRQPIHEPLYTDRTIGWFTATYPVIFRNIGKDIATDLANVKQTLHSIPNKGVGYGQLFGMDINPIPLVTFNYLGEFTDTGSDNGDFIIDETLPTGSTSAPENYCGSDITINSLVQPSGQFCMTMRYNSSLLTREQAVSLVNGTKDELASIVGIVEKSPVIQTPSDVGETEWTLDEYNKIVKDFASRGETIKRIYPLTSMQQGMLLKGLMEPDSVAYRIVSAMEIDTVLSKERLTRVAERLAQKYETLRTAIIYRGVEIYRQAIVEGRPLGVETYDYSDHSDAYGDIMKLRMELLRNMTDLQTKPLYNFISIKISENSSVLLLVTHHIMTDGWSMPLFVKDLLAMIADEIQNKSIPAEASVLDGKFESYVRGILAKDHTAALTYWKKLLEGYDTTAVIKGQQVPESEQSLLDSVDFSLSREDGSVLKQFCADMQVTPNSVVELAWCMLLSSFNRTDDVVFAKVVSGRDNTEQDVSDLVGIFINTVPVRMTFSPEMTVSDGVHAIHQQAAESNRYDFCSLSDIQQQSELGAGLFQSVMVFENYPSDEDDISGGLPFSFKPLVTKDENFDDISITAYVGDDGRMKLNIKFDRSLYREKFVDDIIRVFGNLIHGIINADADTRLSSLELLDAEGKERMMGISAGKHLDVDITMTFAHAFVHRASVCPEKPAVYDAWGFLTYAQMDRYSDVLSHILIDNGVTKDSFVCVMLDRTKEFPMSVLAVHKAGAAYTPLDPEYPNERLSYMIGNSQARVLITTHTVLESKIQEGGFNLGVAKAVYIDDIDFGQTDLDDSPIDLSSPQGLAYMIYTSGSTGKPKGAMLHQAGLWNFINVVIDMEQLTADDRIEGHRSFSFDAHIEDLYPILTLGGSFHIMPSEIRKDLQAIRDFIITHRITGGGYSTAIASLLLNTFDDMPVRFITAGGEKLDGVYSDHIKIINVYGPTECTDDTSYYIINPGERIDNIPIGKSVANNWNFVIDKNGHLLPQGVAGELCFAGIQVGCGYWQLPDRTNLAFEDCPFVAQDIWNRKVRMYHTGDLCTWNVDGDLEYLGRIDFQVKLRGFRIELGEIESRVLCINGITQAAAEVKKINGIDHLILYYTVAAGTSLDSDGIRKELLNSSLAEYMVPDAYVRMDTMPLSPNGKINRKVLPEPSIMAEEIVKPSTDMEQTLYDIACEILKTNMFGVTTNLISAGMTSLQAMRISAAIMQRTGLEIATKELLSNPTVRHLAEIAESGKINKTASIRLGGVDSETTHSISKQSEPKSTNPLHQRPKTDGTATPAKSNPLAKRNGQNGESSGSENNPLLKR